MYYIVLVLDYYRNTFLVHFDTIKSAKHINANVFFYGWSTCIMHDGVAMLFSVQSFPK